MKRLLARLLVPVIVSAALYFGTRGDAPAQTRAPAPTAGQTRGGQISGSGEVLRLLADDNQGSRHQRFILRLPSGQTLLIAHNIDLAERVRDLRIGDRVEFSGEYEPNPQGGVVHWTHRDPAGRHASGWLKHNGREYR